MSDAEMWNRLKPHGGVAVIGLKGPPRKPRDVEREKARERGRPGARGGFYPLLFGREGGLVGSASSDRSRAIPERGGHGTSSRVSPC